MSQGQAYDHIHLLDAGGNELANPLLDLETELWDPDGVRTFRSGEAELPGLSFLRILIDTGTDGAAVVYLDWFQT